MEMDIKDLRYFMAVYEHGGFSRAARVLGTVQSNVSARILALEAFLGGALFERRYRNVVATAKGETLYKYAKSVIAAMDETERVVRQFDAA